MAGKGGKYVVTNSMVNDWPRGTVLTHEQLQTPAVKNAEGKETAPAADLSERLVKIGAIREATADEAKLPFVTLTAFGEVLSPAAVAAMAEKDAQIEFYKQALAAQQPKLAF